MKVLDLEHPTQRNHVWSLEDATKFIESIIQKFPFEPIYIIKNKTFYSVIDGKQRISALLLFAGLLGDKDIVSDLKKSDNQISNNFALDFNFLSNEIKEQYSISEKDIIDFKFLKDKIPKFNQLIAELRFPLYFSNQERKERGFEDNVYELFVKLNSTGIGIEPGELIKATILEKYSKNFKIIEESIEKFANCVSERKLARERIWYLFSLLWFMYSHKENNKFDDSFNAISNLDDKIIEFLKDDGAKVNIVNFISKLNCANDNVKAFIKSNDKSLFNINGSYKSTPINFYVYSVYSYLFWFFDKENDDLELFKNEVVSLISEKDKYLYEMEDASGEVISLKIFRKYSREPQKIRLGIKFAELFDKFKKEENYEELIRDELIKTKN
jgi:hypothetical protein